MTASDDEVRAAIGRLEDRVDELEAELAARTERSLELRIAADFAATEEAGYIDRTFLEKS